MVKFLVLSIVIIPLVLFYLHFYVYKADGLFLNLFTEFIGIGFTVLCVDRIFRHYEKSKWKDVEFSVNNRIIIFLNHIVLGIRVAYNLSPKDIFGDQLDNLKLDTKTLNHIVIQSSTKILEPLTETKLKEMDSSKWKYLMNNLSVAYSQVDDLLLMYSKVLTPIIFKHLLLIQEHLKRAMIGYQIFPEIAEMKELAPYLKMTSEDINKLLNEIKILGEILSKS